MRRMTLLTLTLLSLSASTLAQQVGINIPDPQYDVDIRSLNATMLSQLNLGNADNSHFLRLQSGQNGTLAFPAIFWKHGDSLSMGTDLSGFTEVLRLRSNGTLSLNSALGISLQAADMPLITRGWDPFTSGAYAGIGRWGLFMEQNYLTIGIPDISNRGVQVVRYQPDGSIGSVMMRLQNGNLGLGNNNPQARIDVEAIQAAVRLVSTNSPAGSVIELRSMTNTGNTHPLGAINFNNPANQTPGQIAHTHEGAMIFRAGGFERMRIRHQTGFLGLNTNNPEYMLDVNGDVNLAGRLLTGGNAGFAGQVLTSTGNSAPVWQFPLVNATGFAATLSSTMAIPDNVSTTLAPFNESLGFDNGNVFDDTTGTFIAPTAGVYYLSCKVMWQAASTFDAAPAVIRLMKNGFIIPFGQCVSKLTLDTMNGEDQQFSTLLMLEPGDQILLTVQQFSGSTLEVFANGGSSDTFFTAFKVY